MPFFISIKLYKIYNTLEEVIMTKEKRILIPVTEKEKEELIKKALAAGYRSLSAYLRDKGLDTK